MNRTHEMANSNFSFNGNMTIERNGTDIEDEQLGTLQELGKVLAFMCMLVGTVGNSLTLLVIWRSKKLRTLSNAFVLNLSISDVLFSGLALALRGVFFVFADELKDSWICKATPALTNGFVGASLTTLCAISLTRYLHIMNTAFYKRMLHIKSVVLILSVCWTFPLTLAILPSFGVWGRYEYIPSLWQCSFAVLTDASYRQVTSGMCFFVPCTFMVLCYTKIMVKYYKSRKKVAAWKKTTRSDQRVFSKEKINLTLTMSTIFLVFFITITPYVAVNMYDTHVKKQRYHLIALVFGWMSPCLNPIIYVVMNQNFRTAYRMLFCGSKEILVNNFTASVAVTNINTCT